MSLFFSKCFFICLTILFSGPQLAIPNIYPTPTVNDNSLFYIQRSKNTNAIVYELNRSPEGQINTVEPVKIFWIRYTSDSSLADLTLVQNKYAYGIEATPVNEQKNSFVLHFNAYKKRSFFLMPVKNSKRYAALTKINGQLAELKKVFISTSGGTFWFPQIDYIELTGKDPATQQIVTERFIP